YTVEGGLAVLRGNLAEDGAVFKTAGVDPDVFHFVGTALVCESQDDAVEKILTKQVKPGHVVVVRYEGPAGGPGMQEMLYPTSFIKGRGLGKQVALITDGRFSGGSSGISVGHISPEAAAGGTIGLIEDGDEIEIDVESRLIRVNVPDEVLAERRAKMESWERPWQPAARDRYVSPALQAYAALATSADRGAVRDVARLRRGRPDGAQDEGKGTMSDAITPAEFSAGPGVGDWRVVGGSAVVRYGTGSFATGLRLIMRIGVLAESANHHPDVDLRLGTVTVRTTSHDIGGLSRRDLALAQEVSAAARELSIAADRGPWTASGNPDD